VSDFFEVSGSRERFEHRGRIIEIWKMIASSGPVRRRYHATVDGALLDRSFPDRMAMLDCAVDFIDAAFRPRWSFDDLFCEWIDDCELEPVPIDKDADRRAKLEQVKVERGYSAAEAETARRKLAEMDKKS